MASATSVDSSERSWASAATRKNWFALLSRPWRTAASAGTVLMLSTFGVMIHFYLDAAVSEASRGHPQYRSPHSRSRRKLVRVLLPGSCKPEDDNHYPS